MKVSVIATVKNEEKTIEALVTALAQQTRLPDQTVIVDGGSTDKTFAKLKKLKKKFPQLHLTVVRHVSNRSEGRNQAIRKAKYEWIACTDAGCIPRPNWLFELIKKQLETRALVIAGYTTALTTTAFEEAVAPYVLVQPTRIDSTVFLPATRSLLIARTLFERLGGFDTNLDVSEDYAFAKRIQKTGTEIAFAYEAQVQWQPRTSLAAFFRMVQSMAYWDSRAGITRPKAILVVVRYAIGLVLLVAALVVGKPHLWLALLAGGMFYLGWAIYKNVRFAPRGWYYLPVLQLTADVGVVAGMTQAAVVCTIKKVINFIYGK